MFTCCPCYLLLFQISGYFCVTREGTSTPVEGQTLTPQHNLQHLLQKGITPLWGNSSCFAQEWRFLQVFQLCSKPASSHSHLSEEQRNKILPPAPALTVPPAAAELNQQQGRICMQSAQVSSSEGSAQGQHSCSQRAGPASPPHTPSSVSALGRSSKHSTIPTWALCWRDVTLSRRDPSRSTSHASGCSRIPPSWHGTNTAVLAFALGISHSDISPHLHSSAGWRQGWQREG